MISGGYHRHKYISQAEFRQNFAKSSTHTSHSSFVLSLLLYLSEHRPESEPLLLSEDEGSDELLSELLEDSASSSPFTSGATTAVGFGCDFRCSRKSSLTEAVADDCYSLDKTRDLS